MLQRFKNFIRWQEGVAYLEFAIALPLLVALFMGGVELTRYILIVQKVEKATITVSDIVSQLQTINTTQLNQLVTASTQVMKPYSFGANGYVIISSVTKNGSSPPVINWQYSGGGSWIHASAVGVSGGAATWLPFTLDDKENIVITEVYYNFAPLISNKYVPGKTIYKVATFRPRLGALNSLGG